LGHGVRVIEGLQELIRRRPAGHALPQAFYTSPEVYRLDVERVLRRHWNFVGHVSSIPRVGDYLVAEYDRDSAIVVRGDGDRIHALANVCRHRGSRICSVDAGHAQGGALRCPYHAWTYNLDGSLRKAPWLDPEMDTSTLGLVSLPVEVCQGLIFVSFADEPLDFGAVRRTFDEALEAFDWGSAKVAHEARYAFAANWKLALENQVECYHCVPSHPEFARVHAMARKGSAGAASRVVDRWALEATAGEELVFSSDNALDGTAETGSEDGHLVGPLMGPADAVGSFVVAYAGIVNHFLAYADHGCALRYEPKSANETELTVTWLVRRDANAGVDYDPDRLTWMWRVTVAEDLRIVSENQRGVSSSAYAPGPYVMPIESKTLRLTDWYLRQLELEWSTAHMSASSGVSCLGGA
jgi:phenylpropionate dioxygenase-like ring-hydroxylating dioxygenase large terminal subunit